MTKAEKALIRAAMGIYNKTHTWKLENGTIVSADGNQDKFINACAKLEEEREQIAENIIVPAEEELVSAVEFFDSVTSASKEDQAAVGNDHWEWLISASYKVVQEYKKR